MNGELIEYLDKKFNKIEKDIGEVRSDVKEMKINVGGNKTNILVNFKEAKEERAGIKKRIDETYNAVDGFIKNVIREKLGVDLS